MNRRLQSRYGLMLALVAVSLTGAQAKFARGENVPVERLIANVTTQMQKTPADPEVVYTLGRLHSLAFAEGAGDISVFTQDWGAGGNATPRKIPDFPGYSSVKVKPNATFAMRRTQALTHLRASLRLYRKATEMAPNNGLYWFSYGWLLEQSLPFAAEVDAPFRPAPGKADAAAWRDQALRAYRRAFAASASEDTKRTHILMRTDEVVSVEAGTAILTLLKNQPLTASLSAEKQRIEAHLARMQAIPRAITPLIFPLDGSQRLTDLMQPAARVRFDLAGESGSRVWPWVTPETGILCWDPKHTGRIASGRQLFGSVTWWIFWKNGFEPLAALDDDRNGWLEGKELAGIAVWQDKNGNGVSDPGEVIPIQQFGVQRISVRPQGQIDNALNHSAGIVMQDGSTRPLYDWTPTSIEKRNER